jgi:hypothetical protein
VQKRNNFMISMANKIAQEVMCIPITENLLKKKDGNLIKIVNRIYNEYIGQYEKNMGKGDMGFPTMPLKYNMYKTLSQYNSNDKAVENRYRKVGQRNQILLNVKMSLGMPCFDIFAGFVGIGKVEFDHYSFEIFIKLLYLSRLKL